MSDGITGRPIKGLAATGRTRRVLAAAGVLLASALSLVAAAQAAGIVVSPPAATTTDAVLLDVTTGSICRPQSPPDGPEVSVDLWRIDVLVQLTCPDLIGIPPPPYRFTVSVGQLPPGKFSVRVRQSTRSASGSYTDPVVVLDATFAVSGTLPFFGSQPAQPVSDQPIELRVAASVGWSGFEVGPHAATVTGNVIRIDGCIGAGGFAVSGAYMAATRVGPLPAGQYTVEYYRAYCAPSKPVYALIDTWPLVVAEGAGAHAAPAPPSRAIEYWHEAFDHYFFSVDDHEELALETGAFAGWTRLADTGFGLLQSPAAGRIPVCRFFSIAFGARSSHFYAMGEAECKAVQSNADWMPEGIVGYAYAAHEDGTCDTGVALYRLYNDGQGGAPAHRYTVDPRIRGAMMARGWIPEGAGVGVVACVPALDA